MQKYQKLGMIQLLAPYVLHFANLPPYFFAVSGKRFTVTDKLLRDVSEKLFQLITVTEDCGLMILHQWVKICSESRGFLVAGAEKRIEVQFEHFFQHYQGDAVRLMLATDDRNYGNNPLHYTAMCTSEDAAILIAGKLIVESLDFREQRKKKMSKSTEEAAMFSVLLMMNEENN